MELNGTAVDAVSRLVELHTGQQFGSNRRWRIRSALASLLRDRGIVSSENFALRLTHDAELVRDVVDALLNNETYFFRDRMVFDQLAEQVLPALGRRNRRTRRLSVWSAGCSTGQEVLSLGMVLADRKAHWSGWAVDILGTDVSATAVAAAREGIYSQFEIQRGLGIGEMLSFFEERTDGWQASDSLRAMARYTTHNVLDGPPATECFDLILCRNVLLYFDQETRCRALANLARALAPGGYLLLGSGETVIGQTDLLEIDSDNPGFFRHAAATVAEAPARGRSLASRS
ncbi:hypothetical protein MB02_13855 [Croceicoccus estronivorus]|uniref:CheR family methyltransferase n=1 Tax=Croceicoccus estronivorus TaxID=1172626 RepID=UPI0008366C00|nr:protein-glutamate O-methyltransferase CheR [Croceicoccus estronivorus]OCC22859.1 hypothetical protein MB02_13855 [Croceicoccus estronivorus]